MKTKGSYVDTAVFFFHAIVVQFSFTSKNKSAIVMKSRGKNVQNQDFDSGIETKCE